MEAKLKHLELIQGVINRMAFNSFMLKGWSVVLVSAVLVLISPQDGDNRALIGLLPTLVFWGLDGYFLYQERLYRALYDHVRVLAPDEIDFSMKTGDFAGPNLTWLSAFLSITLILFYAAVLMGVVLAVLIG